MHTVKGIRLCDSGSSASVRCCPAKLCSTVPICVRIAWKKHRILRTDSRDSASLFFADYQNLPRDKRIFFLDNVIDTGTTLKAAEQAVGQKLMPLVYAYTDRAPDNLVEERRNIHMGRDDDIRHDPFRGRIKYQKQYNREDSIFVRVKAAVTVKEAAAFYNVPMDQAGRTKCLFHPDTHPSMKLYDDHYHCFGCQTNGDVIAFAARLFNLRPIDAAKRLANDFGVPIGYLTEQDRENFKKKISIREQLKPEEKLKKDIRWATGVCMDYKAMLTKQKDALAPKTMEEGFSDEFGKLVKDISKVDGDLDYLLTASKSELRGFIDQKESWFRALEELVRRDRVKVLDLSKGVSL